MIKTKRYFVGELQENCYFVTDDEENLSFVVDPGDRCEKLTEDIKRFGENKLKYILLTHGHFDHIGYTAALKKLFPDVIIVIGEADSGFTSDDMLNLSAYFDMMPLEHFKADITVTDGTELDFGSKKIKVIATPGHTKGGVCYQIDDILYTGDTLMRMTTGRTDFPSGSTKEMLASIKKLAALEGNYKIYCGHGESSDLDFERKNNYAVRLDADDDLY